MISLETSAKNEIQLNTQTVRGMGAADEVGSSWLGGLSA